MYDIDEKYFLILKNFAYLDVYRDDIKLNLAKISGIAEKYRASEAPTLQELQIDRPILMESIRIVEQKIEDMSIRLEGIQKTLTCCKNCEKKKREVRKMINTQNKNKNKNKSLVLLLIHIKRVERDLKNAQLELNEIQKILRRQKNG